MYQHYMTNKMKLNICSNIKIFNNEISVDIPQNYEIVDLSESDVDELQDFVLLKKHTSVFSIQRMIREDNNIANIASELIRFMSSGLQGQQKIRWCKRDTNEFEQAMIEKKSDSEGEKSHCLMAILRGKERDYFFRWETVGEDPENDKLLFSRVLDSFHEIND